LSLVEFVKPDGTKPARLLRDKATGNLVLEYTGVDGNIYRVPVLLVFLPQEIGDLAGQLTLADLFTLLRVVIVDSKIIVPVDVQARLKEFFALFSGTVTADGSTTAIDVSRYLSMRFMVKVTAVSGTNPILDIYIDGLYDATGDWVPQLSRTEITTTGVYEIGQLDNLTFRNIRARWVLRGTSPSFTITITAQAVV